MKTLFDAGPQGRQRRPAWLRRQYRGRAAAHVTQLELGAARRGDAALGWTLASIDRRPAHRGSQPQPPTSAISPRSRAWWISCWRAMRSRRADGATHPALRARRSRGRDMCGPSSGAITGAILYEGWATTLEAARAARGRAARSRSSRATSTARSGRWPASSARRCRCGSWRTPQRGNRAFCNLNEGLGKVLRFGANSPDVIDRLRWLGSEFFSAMQAARARSGRRRSEAADGAGAAHGRRAAQPQRRGLRAPVQATHAGVAALQTRRAAIAARARASSPATITSSSTSRWRPASRCSDAAHGVPGSSMVTVMARNGVNFGIRLSGTGDRWFQAPANPVDGLYFPGYTLEDAAAGPRRLRHHRDQRARRLRDGGLPRHRPVRRRHAAGRERQQPPCAHHARRNRAFTLPGAHWIDLVRWTLATPSVEGAINLCAPEPATNATFGSTLARLLHRPFVAHVPAFALRLALGELAEALLTGQRARPARALVEGFRFQWPSLEPALRDLLQLPGPDR